MQSILATVAAIAMAAASQWSAEIPDPPAGYSWNKVNDMKGAFLVPDGWHVLREKSKGTLAYFVTERPFKPPEKYLIGASLNIFLANPSAPSQIEAVVAAEAKQYSVELEPGGFGPFKTMQCQYEIPATPEHGAITMFRLAVANPKTNATYLVSFESPTAEWKRAWAIGEKILKMLALNDKV